MPTPFASPLFLFLCMQRSRAASSFPLFRSLPPFGPRRVARLPPPFLSGTWVFLSFPGGSSWPPQTATTPLAKSPGRPSFPFRRNCAGSFFFFASFAGIHRDFLTRTAPLSKHRDQWHCLFSKSGLSARVFSGCRAMKDMTACRKARTTILSSKTCLDRDPSFLPPLKMESHPIFFFFVCFGILGFDAASLIAGKDKFTAFTPFSFSVLTQGPLLSSSAMKLSDSPLSPF